MTSRTWLAVALCCFVWFGYMKWFAPVPHSETNPAVEQNATESAAKQPAENPAKLPTPLTAEVFSGQALKAGTDEVLKNEKVEIAFSNVGGKISRVTLENYRQGIDQASPYITTITPEQFPYALGTFFSESALAPLANGVYQSNRNDGELVFRHAIAGVALEKHYKLAGDGYFLESTYTFDFGKSERTNWGFLYIPLGGSSLSYDGKDPLKAWEAVTYQNESVTRKAYDKIGAEVVQQGNTSWLSFGNRYFATTLINQSQLNPDVVFVKRGDFGGAYLRFPLQLTSGQKQLNFRFRIYAGPKDYSDLATVPGMKQLINYGTFSIFAYPLLGLMRFFYRFVHNYGFAIILVTLLVRLLFYPLSLKSYQSMRAMQKLQPQIAQLKEKYKDDMQKFNQEQMTLFKAHKVNPMGGCLPMLVQMPVFFALYAVLGNSIELFHAPFFGWVRDLSAKDPLYIIPVLMGISMFAQQKMTPTASMDPAQAKMMLIMPVVFSFIMFNLPSGLTLYIFVSTLLGIVQQLSIAKDKGAGAKLVPVSPGSPSK